MTALIISLAPILALLLLVLAAALFVHLHAPGRNVVKLLVVPLAIACWIVVPTVFVQRMGYSISWPLPAEFTFLAYRPIVAGGVKRELEIWIREDGATRLYRTPYSRQMEQMLQDAAKGAKGGREARIKRRGKGLPGKPGVQGHEPDAGYELRFEGPVDMPKEAPPGAPPPIHQEPEEPLTKRYSI